MRDREREGVEERKEKAADWTYVFFLGLGVLPRLRFFRQGNGRTVASFFCYLFSLTGPNQRSCRKNEINMLIKNALRLFFSVLVYVSPSSFKTEGTVSVIFG